MLKDVSLEQESVEMAELKRLPYKVIIMWLDTSLQNVYKRVHNPPTNNDQFFVMLLFSKGFPMNFL